MMNYWGPSFRQTKHAPLKVLCWAVTKSRYGIGGCLFVFRLPFRVKKASVSVSYKEMEMEMEMEFAVEFLTPVVLHIPSHLIKEVGEDVLGNRWWAPDSSLDDIPF